MFHTQITAQWSLKRQLDRLSLPSFLSQLLNQAAEWKLQAKMLKEQETVLQAQVKWGGDAWGVLSFCSQVTWLRPRAGLQKACMWQREGDGNCK